MCKIVMGNYLSRSYVKFARTSNFLDKLVQQFKICKHFFKSWTLDEKTVI